MPYTRNEACYTLSNLHITTHRTKTCRHKLLTKACHALISLHITTHRPITTLKNKACHKQTTAIKNITKVYYNQIFILTSGDNLQLQHEKQKIEQENGIPHDKQRFYRRGKLTNHIELKHALPHNTNNRPPASTSALQ